jgi:hypothetical protein
LPVPVITQRIGLALIPMSSTAGDLRWPLETRRHCPHSPINNRVGALTEGKAKQKNAF